MPDGFIADLIRYDDGYIAVVRSMVTTYVAKGDFGKPWTVHHRYASRFQNGPGIYVTNYVDSLAFSLDNGETWNLVQTDYLVR